MGSKRLRSPWPILLLLVVLAVAVAALMIEVRLSRSVATPEPTVVPSTKGGGNTDVPIRDSVSVMKDGTGG